MAVDGGGGDLDDAFADFLKEVAEEDSEAPGTPPQKRPRQERININNLTKAEPETPSREVSAERLRKAAYLGDVTAVESALGGLSAPERLLLIDDLDSDDGFAALHLAVIRGHPVVMRRLVALRADVDVPTRAGDTPLMWAAHLGKLDVCKELLKAGADASAKNKAKTAASEAKAGGHKRVHQFLENHAFDVAAGLNKRKSAVEKAAEARRAANMAMLEQAARAAKEQEEEEAFWGAVRSRQQNRSARGEDVDAAARRACADARAAAARAAEAAAAIAVVPEKMRPHYKTLGLESDDGEVEVRRAYRLLALKHHPDKNPGDPAGAKERFTKLAVAYEAVCEHLASLRKPGAGGGACFAPPSNY